MISLTLGNGCLFSSLFAIWVQTGVYVCLRQGKADDRTGYQNTTPPCIRVHENGKTHGIFLCSPWHRFHLHILYPCKSHCTFFPIHSISLPINRSSINLLEPNYEVFTPEYQVRRISLVRQNLVPNARASIPYIGKINERRARESSTKRTCHGVPTCNNPPLLLLWPSLPPNQVFLFLYACRTQMTILNCRLGSYPFSADLRAPILPFKCNVSHLLIIVNALGTAADIQPLQLHGIDNTWKKCLTVTSFSTRQLSFLTG